MKRSNNRVPRASPFGTDVVSQVLHCRCRQVLLAISFLLVSCSPPLTPEQQAIVDDVDAAMDRIERKSETVLAGMEEEVFENCMGASLDEIEKQLERDMDVGSTDGFEQVQACVRRLEELMDDTFLFMRQRIEAWSRTPH